jgi:hypothetical protein
MGVFVILFMNILAVANFKQMSAETVVQATEA